MRGSLPAPLAGQPDRRARVENPPKRCSENVAGNGISFNRTTRNVSTVLGPRARRDVCGVIERLKGQGKTVFLTTHYMDEAEYLADIVSIIDHGQIIASGTPDQLIDTHGGKKTLIIRDAGQEGITQLPPGLSKAELRNAGDIAIPLSNGELTSILMSLAQTPLHDREIEVRRPTLDDVFLNLTGRRVSEEGN